MSRMSIIGVRFEADYDRARQQYDEFRRYVEGNPPRVSVQMTTAPGGGGGGLPSTASAAQAQAGGGQLVSTFGGAQVLTRPAPSVVYPTQAAGPSYQSPTTAPQVAPQIPVPAGYVPQAMRRPPEHITADIQAAVEARDPTRYQALMDELRGSYGTTAGESRELRRTDTLIEREQRRAQRIQERDDRREAQAADRTEQRQQRLSEQYDARFERRQVADRQRSSAALEAEGAAEGRRMRNLDTAIERAADDEIRRAARMAAPGGGRPDVQVDEPEGGGGGGRGGFLRRGFGRTVSAFFLLRELENVATGEQEYTNAMALAGNDPRAQLAATQRLRQTVTSIPILGFVAGQIIDPAGQTTQDIEGMLRTGQLGEAALDARKGLQDFNRSTTERAAVLGASPSQRAVIQAGQQFDAEIRQRLQIVSTATDADVKKRDNDIAEARRKYESVTHENRGFFQTLLHGGSVNALDAYNAKKEMEASIQTAYNEFNKHVTGGEPSPTERLALGAPVREAVRVRAMAERVEMATAQAGTDVAGAAVAYANEFAAGGGSPNYQAEQRMRRAKNAADEAVVLAKFGFGPAFHATVLGHRADETIADAIHNRQLDIEHTVFQGNIEAMTKDLAGDPLGARLAASAARYEAQRKALDVNDKKGKDQLDTQEKLEAGQINRQWQTQGALLNLGQVTTRAATLNRLDRSPTAAEAAELAGGGIMSAVQLEMAGRPAQAQYQLGNTSLALDLLRQNYLDNFRGVQIDLRNIDTQGPRDSEDINRVVSAIDNLQNSLGDRFERAIAEAKSAP